MKNQSGFTLVEVLISIVLLSIGLMAVAAMQATAISGNKHSANGTTAVKLAEYMVDVIRVKGGNNPSTYNGLDTAATGCTSGDCLVWKSALQTSALQNARGTVTVNKDIPTTNVDQIKVKVEWGPTGAKRNVEFVTVKETWGT